MTDEMKPPTRLIEGADDAYLRDLLGAGAGELPNDAAMSRLASKLGPILIGGAGGAGGAAAAGGGATAPLATGAAATAATGTAGKAILGAVVIAMAVGVAGVAVKSTTTSSPTPSASTQTQAPPPTQAPTSTSTPTSTSFSTPTSTSTSTSTPTATTTSTYAPPAASAPAPSETDLLNSAQDSLRSNPSDALAKTNEHRRRYPDGLLAQEREVIAVEALEKLGRSADADQRAAAFAKRYPGSSHISRLSTLVGHPL